MRGQVQGVYSFMVSGAASRSVLIYRCLYIQKQDTAFGSAKSSVLLPEKLLLALLNSAFYNKRW